MCCLLVPPGVLTGLGLQEEIVYLICPQLGCAMAHFW